MFSALTSDWFLLREDSEMSQELYRQCIDACVLALSQCEICLNNCLTQDNLKQFYRCIQLCRDCSTVCAAALRLLCANSEFAQVICVVCSKICRACADECSRLQEISESFHACAAACRDCAEQCAKIAHNEPAADDEAVLFQLKQ